jgi:hypothetical protein
MFVILGVGMANFLISKGFPLQKIDRDYKDGTRLIFLFKDSDELHKAMSLFPRYGGAKNDRSGERDTPTSL